MGELLDKYIGRDNYVVGVDEAAFYGPKLDIQCMSEPCFVVIVKSTARSSVTLKPEDPTA